MRVHYISLGREGKAHSDVVDGVDTVRCMTKQTYRLTKSGYDGTITLNNVTFIMVTDPEPEKKETE